MSYKSDMEQFNREVETRKKQWQTILKISVVALAALILITGAVAIITALNGGFSSNPSSYGDGGSGGGDTQKPVIKGPEGNVAVAYIGETISYKSFVTVTDNAGTPELSVDNSAVKPDTEGSYPVKYTATDAAGNKTTYTLTLVVRKGDYSYDKLMALVAAKASELGMSKDMSKTELVRKIYDFVNDPGASSGNDANIYFSDHSNTPTQQDGIRALWKVDWIEEASRTLEMTRMKGDCYTYYSVSKAFFEYFGIENLGIKRSEKSNVAGTHFWSLVNVGTESNPQWYYYDATRLAGTFQTGGGNNGCLMTEEKMNSYKGSHGETQFYLVDKQAWEADMNRKFPTIATEPIQ